MLRKTLITVALTAGGLVAMQGSALAHFCMPADKPAGAGATSDFETVNKAGKPVVRGAFYDGSLFGGSDGFIRGGLKEGEDFKQFGMATIQAICNGPADHGIVDPYGDFNAEVCESG